MSDAPCINSVSLEALVRRFGALPEALQLEAFRRLRTLLLVAESDSQAIVDVELEERAAALTAIRTAASLLGKPHGEWPTGKEFDALSARLDGWTEKKVRRLFGRWI